MQKKVALITYHSSYNFGSMLQTFATYNAIKHIRGNCTIINYRLHGKTLGYVQVEGKEKIREERFESFIHSLNLTETCHDYNIALSQMEDFDILVSGSDQILNKNTRTLSRLPYDYMRPYLVDVVNKIKISYASSYFSMSNEQLSNIAKYIQNFDYFSTREVSSINLMSPYYSKKIHVVCDPTYLFSKNDWINMLSLKKWGGQKFILYYTLQSGEYVLNNIKLLLSAIKGNDIQVKIIAPFFKYDFESIDKRIIDSITDGPTDFMNEIYNSTFVLTDSYHGTILSALFNKNFISLYVGDLPDVRKTDALKQIGLESRYKKNICDIKYEDFFKDDVDYKNVSKKIAVWRKRSWRYLKGALSNHKSINFDIRISLRKFKKTKFGKFLSKITPKFVKKLIKKMFRL